jgi:hypothetical protein
MVGFGATLTFKEIAPRSLTFVGITIQKKGRLILESEYGNTTDRWNINLFADAGPLRRDGKLTVEGGGILETRRLRINAESVDVQYAGLIDLNGQGYVAGNMRRAALDIFTIVFAIFTFFAKFIFGCGIAFLEKWVFSDRDRQRKQFKKKVLLSFLKKKTQDCFLSISAECFEFFIFNLGVI